MSFEQYAWKRANVTETPWLLETERWDVIPACSACVGVVYQRETRLYYPKRITAKLAKREKADDAGGFGLGEWVRSIPASRGAPLPVPLNSKCVLFACLACSAVQLH